MPPRKSRLDPASLPLEQRVNRPSVVTWNSSQLGPKARRHESRVNVIRHSRLYPCKCTCHSRVQCANLRLVSLPAPQLPSRAIRRLIDLDVAAENPAQRNQITMSLRMLRTFPRLQMSSHCPRARETSCEDALQSRNLTDALAGSSTTLCKVGRGCSSRKGRSIEWRMETSSTTFWSSSVYGMLKNRRSDLG